MALQKCPNKHQKCCMVIFLLIHHRHSLNNFLAVLYQRSLFLNWESSTAIPVLSLFWPEMETCQNMQEYCEWGVLKSPLGPQTQFYTRSEPRCLDIDYSINLLCHLSEFVTTHAVFHEQGCTSLQPSGDRRSATILIYIFKKVPHRAIFCTDRRCILFQWHRRQQTSDVMGDFSKAFRDLIRLPLKTVIKFLFKGTGTRETLAVLCQSFCSLTHELCHGSDSVFLRGFGPSP